MTHGMHYGKGKAGGAYDGGRSASGPMDSKKLGNEKYATTSTSDTHGKIQKKY